MNPFLKLNSLRKSWQTSRHAYQSISMFRIMILSVLTGLGAGVFAIIFFFGIEGLRFLFLHQLAGAFIPVPSGEALFSAKEAAHSGSQRAWLIPVLTTSVGLLTGWLVQRLIPECQQDGATDGTDVMTRSFHQERGVIRPLSSIIKGSTAILTIASGCSAGREGPITHIGAGLGSWLSSKLQLSARERRILLLAGAGGA